MDHECYSMNSLVCRMFGFLSHSHSHSQSQSHIKAALFVATEAKRRIRLLRADLNAIEETETSEYL